MMNTRWMTLVVGFGMLCLGAAGGLAQEKPVKPPEKREVVEPPLQDPTYPGPIFEKILNQKAVKAGPMKLPAIALKGRIIARGKPATALLEVEGKLYLV